MKICAVGQTPGKHRAECFFYINLNRDHLKLSSWSLHIYIHNILYKKATSLLFVFWAFSYHPATWQKYQTTTQHRFNRGWCMPRDVAACARRHQLGPSLRYFLKTIEIIFEFKQFLLLAAWLVHLTCARRGNEIISIIVAGNGRRLQWKLWNFDMLVLYPFTPPPRFYWQNSRLSCVPLLYRSWGRYHTVNVFYTTTANRLHCCSLL